MGLDGISVNQLRAVQENNSLEMNNISRLNQTVNSKAVDGLSEGQVVDPDKEKEHDNSQFSNGNSDLTEEETEEQVIKYDLSQTDKYSLKIDELTNAITIIDNKTNEVIQVLDSAALSRFVNFLADARGTIINRKY